MRKAKIAELRNNLSRYLEYVRSGNTVLVLDRDRPIARIVPLGARGADQADQEDPLSRLEREGLIRRGSGGFSEWLLSEWLRRRKPVRLEGGALRDLG